MYCRDKVGRGVEVRRLLMGRIESGKYPIAGIDEVICPFEP